MNENKYLTGIPQEVEQYGFAKVLLVRRELLHIKHIFTELFVRKNELHFYIEDLHKYMTYMTNRMRRIAHFSRNYSNNLDNIVKHESDRFFDSIKFYEGLDNVIVLDFDGVVTEKSFEELYNLCIDRCKTVICSANPTITKEWFIKRQLPLPHEIYANKGAQAKERKLLLIAEKHDMTFYVDNEVCYLRHAWLHGIKTFIYTNKKIKYFSLNSK